MDERRTGAHWFLKSPPPRSWLAQPYVAPLIWYKDLIATLPNGAALAPDTWLYDPMRYLRGTCEYTRGHFWACVRGEQDIASMAAGLPHAGKAQLVAALYHVDAPPRVLREALRAAQLESYSVLASEMRADPKQFSTDRFMAAFRRAEFPIPDHFPETVTVYHGTADGAGPAERFSWTTSRAAACWWAIRVNDTTFRPEAVPVSPRVLRRKIPRSSIVFYEPPGAFTQPHDEVGFDLPSEDDVVDGTLDEWIRTSRAFMRMASRTPWGNGTAPFMEPPPPEVTPPGSLAGQYANQAEWPALAADLLNGVRSQLDSHLAARLDRVLAGDTPPMPFLEALAPSDRGPVVVALYLRGHAPDTLRPAVEHAWTKARWSLIEVTDWFGLTCLPNLFRACRFPLPAEWGDIITIYRGDRGVTVEEARQDRSWTTDYPTACFLALEYLKANGVTGAPVVLRQEVSRSDVLAIITSDGMSEAVIDAAPGGDVHGTPDAWQTAQAEFALRWLRDNEGETDVGTAAWRQRRRLDAWQQGAPIQILHSQGIAL